MEATEIWLDHGGARLFACELGGGAPLLFLHGGLSDHRGTTMRLDALASSMRLVAPDQRGSGRSHFAGALDWDALADDVAAWLDALAIDRAIVGGTSFGSGVALRFALRHPARVRALVLASPAFAGADRGYTEAQRVAMRAMREHGERAAEEGIEALAPLVERLPPPMRERALQMFRSFDPASVVATTRFLDSGSQPFDRIEQLAAITVPTLIVPGIDPEHPPEVAARYAAHLPNATTRHDVDLAAAIRSFATQLTRA